MTQSVASGSDIHQTACVSAVSVSAAFALQGVDLPT